MAKRATAAAFSSILLDEASPEPLYRQVYSRLRTAILMRQLPPGTRLPSTRELANELNISRNTVMNAYDQLLAEGYLEGQVGSGTFVSLALPDDLLQARASTSGARKLSPIGRGLSRRGQLLANTRTAVTPIVGKARPLLPEGLLSMSFRYPCGPALLRAIGNVYRRACWITVKQPAIDLCAKQLPHT